MNRPNSISYRSWSATLLVLLVFAVSMLGGLPGGLTRVRAAASNLDDLRQRIDTKNSEMERLEQQLRNTERKLGDTKRHEGNLQRQLNQIESRLMATINERLRLEKQLKEAEEKVKEVEARLVEAEADLDRQNDLLLRRVRAIYEEGTVSYLEVLLASDSFADFMTRYELLKQVVEADVHLFYQVEADRNLVAAKREELIAYREEVARLKDQVAAREQDFRVQVAAKEKTLDEIHQDVTALEAQYKELDRISEQIKRELVNLQRQYQIQSGELSFMRPVSGGWISSQFGNRWHPILKTYKLHTGTDFAVPWGTAVHAAERGIVVKAGWMGGYGNTVMILHDSAKGLSSLYAHNSSLEVSEGQTVERGQVIARAGSTGFSTGPHVHWEIRVDGVPVNPLNYLK